MKLNNLKNLNRKNRKCVGRGNGSGHGTYSTRGCKGAGQRSGGVKGGVHEGGQTPLIIRLPKLKGFNPINRINFAIVNIGDIEKCFSDGDSVDQTSLIEKGLVNQKSAPIKVLGNGEITKKIKLICEKVTKSAQEKIEKAGGSVDLTILKEPKKS